MKKSELIEKINAFVATIFPQEEKKEELKEEIVTEEIKNQATLEVGKALPDGEYEIEDQIVVLKDGLVAEIKPKEEEKPAEETVVEEEMKEEKPTEKLSAQEPEVKINLEDERNKIRVEFEKEYNEKLEDIKKEFNTKLEKLAESVKTTGIVQAPVETKPEVLSDAEWVIKNRKK